MVVGSRGTGTDGLPGGPFRQYGIVSHTVACTSTFPVASAGAAGEAAWSAGERGDAAVPVACFLGVADADPPSPSAFRFAGLGLKNDAIDAIMVL